MAEIKSETFERKKLCKATAIFDEDIVLHFDIKDVVEMDMRRILTTLILPAKLEATIEHHIESEYVPTTWFQHLKMRLGLQHEERAIEKRKFEYHYTLHPELQARLEDAFKRNRYTIRYRMEEP